MRLSDIHVEGENVEENMEENEEEASDPDDGVYTASTEYCSLFFAHAEV